MNKTRLQKIAKLVAARTKNKAVDKDSIDYSTWSLEELKSHYDEIMSYPSDSPFLQKLEKMPLEELKLCYADLMRSPDREDNIADFVLNWKGQKT